VGAGLLALYKPSRTLRQMKASICSLSEAVELGSALQQLNIQKNFSLSSMKDSFDIVDVYNIFASVRETIICYFELIQWLEWARTHRNCVRGPTRLLQSVPGPPIVEIRAGTLFCVTRNALRRRRRIQITLYSSSPVYHVTTVCM